MDKNKKMLLDNSLFFACVEEAIDGGESIEIVVKGMSMQPTLRNGADKVLLSPLSAHPLYIGAIVLFRYRGQHVLHRLVKEERDYYVFQGDNVHTHQERIRKEEVVAVVEKILYRDGAAIDCFSSHYQRAARRMVCLRPLHYVYKRIKARLRRSICRLKGY